MPLLGRTQSSSNVANLAAGLDVIYRTRSGIGSNIMAEAFFGDNIEI